MLTPRGCEEYKKLVSEMEKETKSKEKAISELRAQIAQSQEKTGQMKAQLMAAKELMKVTNEQMQTVQEEYAVKTREYKERVGRRNDEELAVKEAQQILNSKDMKKILAKKAASYVQYEVPARKKGRMGSALMGHCKFHVFWQTFWVLPLAWFYLPKGARAYLLSPSCQTHYSCSGPISADPICRNQEVPAAASRKRFSI